MPTPPQTITLSPASQPAAPGTITLAAASQPSAPSTITRSAASQPSAPSTISLAPDALAAYLISGLSPAGANGYVITVPDSEEGVQWTTDGTGTASLSGYFVSIVNPGEAGTTWTVVALLDGVEFAAWSSEETFTEAPTPDLVETWDADTDTYPGMTGSPVFGGPMSPPPSTITLSAASQPSAPSTISRSAASQPSAPSTISLSAASQPSAPSTISLTAASQPAAPGVITPS